MSFNHQTRSLGCISPSKKGTHKNKSMSAVEKRELQTVNHTQGEVRERIAATITTPNKSWAKQRKHKKYALSRSFFGQYAWLRLIIRYTFVWYWMILDVWQRCSHFCFINSQTWTCFTKCNIFYNILPTKFWCKTILRNIKPWDKLHPMVMSEWITYNFFIFAIGFSHES